MKTKMKTVIIAVSILFTQQLSFAQDSTSSKVANEFTFAASYAQKRKVTHTRESLKVAGFVALDWARLHPVSKNGKLKIGYGIRSTLAPFIYGDAYTSGPAGAQDTLGVMRSDFYAFNLALHAQFALTAKLSIGINTDFIGFTLGSKIEPADEDEFIPENGALYISSDPGPWDENQEYYFPIEPTRFNFLGVQGTLNSVPMYMRFQFNDHFSLKGGMAFLKKEYKTSTMMNYSDKHRNRRVMVNLGATFTL